MKTVEGLLLDLLPEEYAVCRMPAASERPDWAGGDRFMALIQTPEELTVICRQDEIPADIQAERGWRTLKFRGPLDFSLVGVLLGVLRHLAEAGMSVFVVSAYSTDFVMIRKEVLTHACEVLRDAGYHIEA